MDNNMTVYTCVPEWDAMLTCIYEAWSSGLGHANVRLAIEPIDQYSLWETYVHVDADIKKAEQVARSVRQKISYQFYNDLAYASMAYEPDTLDTIYRVMILGFAYGPATLQMVQYKDVFRLNEIRGRVGREAHHFVEFIRFHALPGNMYIAHIEPKSRVAASLGPAFIDRMPSEHWMIVDDIHKEAIVHPADSPYYLRLLTDEELARLSETENVNDEYTDMWKTFFHAVSIKERENKQCQDNLFPIWTRKHAVEFL